MRNHRSLPCFTLVTRRHAGHLREEDPLRLAGAVAVGPGDLERVGQAAGEIALPVGDEPIDIAGEPLADGVHVALRIEALAFMRRCA